MKGIVINYYCKERLIKYFSRKSAENKIAGMKKDFWERTCNRPPLSKLDR